MTTIQPGRCRHNKGKEYSQMHQTTVQTLFRQFAAPLAAYAATSPERKELRQRYQLRRKEQA